MSKEIKIAFFGGEPLGVPTLEALKGAGIMPSLIVTSPDRPSGRKLLLAPPPVKMWAEKNGVEIFQPESLKNRDTLLKLTDQTWDLFVVVAYNHILPEWLIDLPKYKTINLHPSLLPKLRGPSPIRTAILEDAREAIGVSVMLLDKEMDHGPILEQDKVTIEDVAWPMPGQALDQLLAEQGGQLLAQTILSLNEAGAKPTPQDHDQATYTRKISKTMGELQLDPNQLPTGSEAYQMYLKICAFDGWPGTYFFHNGQRVKINQAKLEANGQLNIKAVTPEGKKEIDFDTWLKQTP